MINCGTCRFFATKPFDSDTCECRRHSPVLHPDTSMDGCWPITQAVSWCGEHEPEKPPKEDLARYYHDTWSGWMQALIHQAEEKYEADDSILIKWPIRMVDRWVRQMRTPYDDLPDAEREAAKLEARKIMNIIRKGGQ